MSEAKATPEVTPYCRICGAFPASDLGYPGVCRWESCEREAERIERRADAIATPPGDSAAIKAFREGFTAGLSDAVRRAMGDDIDES